MFNEENTVEQMALDMLCGGVISNMVAEELASYGGEIKGWRFVAAEELPRQHSDVLVESMVRDALIRLNPEIKAQPDRADEVLYRLRTIPLSVQSEGLVRANELFAEWLRGEKSMPFGERGEHTPVRLIDFENLSNNDYVVTNQWVYPVKEGGRRFDIVMLVNGIPLVVGEAKTPVRPAVTWVDGASDIHNGYEQSVPQMFVPNVLSFATEGKSYRYGSVRMPIDIWGPWHEGENKAEGTLADVQRSIRSMLCPHVVLDILQNFTLFATDKKHRRIKIICRYQQYEGANLMVARVVKGYPKKGLIWHFQGSGKSLLMVFAAQKLRMHRKLGNPTVMIVVDRIDLDTQITATFNAADIPNMIGAATRQELQSLLAADTRKIIITTIHKFGEADGRLNERSNIIVMVDEAHRTQEGDLGRKMRDALPNAFLFGLTGTPINKRDRNTFWAFGADEDEQGYMSRYSFQDSIRDKATLPLHFEAVDVKLHINKDAIDEAYSQMTDELSELDRDDLAKRAAKMAVLIKAPARVNAICQHIVKHFQEKVEPNGFKAQVVTFDRECCVLYKKAMDELVGPEASAIVMHTQGGKSDEYAEWKLTKDEEEKLLDRFRDPNDPLKFLIVTSKLLTGFDAPILQVMYLDKPMKDHNLLQAICRTNRVYPGKTHGLIVDYLGIFDDVATALDFDEKAVQKVITNLDDLKKELPGVVAKSLSFFPGVDRTVGGYEGLIAAQDCLPDNETRDKFAAEYSVLSCLWEALSPDPCLGPYEKDYKWLTQVYESVKPPSGNGKLLWHALGAKTIELVHKNVHLETVRDDLDTLVMDAEVLEGLLDAKDPDKKSKEIEIKLIARLRKHKDNPKFVALGERLEKLKERHEQGLLHSLDFLKELLTLAKEVVQAEKQVDPVDEQAKAKAALTELFAEVKSGKTPVVVERVVNDIDEIVRMVRFPGWQNTHAGEREVQKALRKVIYVKYQVKDQDLFDKAYSYVKQYY
ncbi:type I restriction-modification system, restriction subunit [Syntrophotalea carbinolica DSM 2380]|uniref:Type I restriction enzyme endonuclease subunit n=1 Tax=Syntrophotalea carbinolica (strain DSM 2380 / NBRC 103641 / GraBd1) TaxID=338963 RepID=Q3A0E9_SYNC1|nr:HsdR family type I site-specific deoxyribonuclease [Syntrophotalea carbinolica]ABA90158.1 type I restriction-modification system, restriction subunit [Syntrophotalea carbinolica DSM 2380]